MRFVNKIILILLLMLLVGCSGRYFTPVCRHEAVMAALTVGERYPVRLMWGNTDLGIDKAGQMFNAHVQTQAFINGQWQWLQVIGGRVQTGGQDNFKPSDSFTVREFIDQEWGVRVK